MQKKITIHENGTKALQKAIRRLARHAEKMKYSDPHIISVSGPQETRRTVIIKDESDHTERNYVIMTRQAIIDLPPQFLNYEDAEYNIIGRVDNIEREAEITSDPDHFKSIMAAAAGFNWKCQDCGRALGKAYAVKHKATGKILLTGQECTKKYTGEDGHAILKAVEALLLVCIDTSPEIEGAPGIGGRPGLQLIDLTEYLAACLVAVDEAGKYVKRWQEDYYCGDFIENEDCTRNKALEILARRPESLTKAKLDQADMQLDAWTDAYELDRNGERNDFVTNLKALIDRGWITEKTAGIAAYLVNKPPQEPQESLSRHIGTVKERRIFEDLTVKSTIERDGEYGTTTIIKFEDPQHNLLTWFASGVKNIKEGEMLTIKATVKAHSEYRGEKETIITRAKEVKK